MKYKVLVLSERPEYVRFIRAAAVHFETLDAASCREGLTRLKQEPNVAVLIVSTGLPDLDEGSFFGQAAAISDAIVVLLTGGNDLRRCLDLMNAHHAFRILPYPADQEMVNQVLRDSLEQHQLVTQKQVLNSQLVHLRLKDPLTGCYNKRYLSERLPGELGRSIRYSQYLSIIYCDIDQLGEINRQWDRTAGDRLLTAVGHAAMRIVRQDIDWVTRWNDDDFLIVLPETPLRGAAIVAERLRQTVKTLEVVKNQGEFQPTACFGISCYAPETPRRNTTSTDLLTIASQCLLQAKIDGKDKILCCP